MLKGTEFTPDWLQAGADGAKDGEGAATLPVFHLRWGSVMERDEFEAELEGRYRAGLVFGFALMEAALSGIAALIDGDDAASLAELVRSEFGGGDLSAEERALVDGAREVLAEHWPDYRALVEQEARRNAYLPTLAFARWCEGWENVTGTDGAPLEYRRDKVRGIPQDVLRKVPFTLMRAAGIEAYGRQYGKTQAKN